MDDDPKTNRRAVLLIPGLFSPRWHMSGLRRTLDRRGFDAQIWDDASVFGELRTSVERLQRRLDQHGNGLGIVTHSFGDWLFRQIAAHGDASMVHSLASLVPVMATSRVARAFRRLGAIMPEIGVMADHALASSALEIPREIDRLVVWSRLDPWVGRPMPGELANIHRVVVPGTHNTILWQPGVHRLVAAHLSGRADEDATVGGQTSGNSP